MAVGTVVITSTSDLRKFYKDNKIVDETKNEALKKDMAKKRWAERVEVSKQKILDKKLEHDKKEAKKANELSKQLAEDQGVLPRTRKTKWVECRYILFYCSRMFVLMSRMSFEISGYKLEGVMNMTFRVVAKRVQGMNLCFR